MAVVADVTIAATSTSILTAAAGKAMSGPLALKNASTEVITLTIAGGDDYDLNPGEVLPVIPGHVITGTAVSGAAKLQIIQGVIPSDQSAASGGGPVLASGSAAAACSTMWSVGQDDFTAAYASATTLTMGAFPSAMGTVVSGNFALVIATTTAGLQTAYVPTRNAMSLSGSTLTVTGAAFGATDTFDVFVWGPPKAYSAAENARQFTLLNPAWTYISPDKRTASSQGDGTTTYYYDLEGYKYFGIQIEDTAGSAGSNAYTIEGTWEDDGTAQASCYYTDQTLDWFGIASVNSTAIAAKPSDGVFEWVTPVTSRYIAVVVTRTLDGGSTDGAWTLHSRAVR